MYSHGIGLGNRRPCSLIGFCHAGINGRTEVCHLPDKAGTLIAANVSASRFVNRDGIFAHFPLLA